MSIIIGFTDENFFLSFLEGTVLHSVRDTINPIVDDGISAADFFARFLPQINF